MIWSVYFFKRLTTFPSFGFCGVCNALVLESSYSIFLKAYPWKLKVYYNVKNYVFKRSQIRISIFFINKSYFLSIETEYLQHVLFKNISSLFSYEFTSNDFFQSWRLFRSDSRPDPRSQSVTGRNPKRLDRDQKFLIAIRPFRISIGNPNFDPDCLVKTLSKFHIIFFQWWKWFTN